MCFQEPEYRLIHCLTISMRAFRWMNFWTTSRQFREIRLLLCLKLPATF